MPPKKKTNSVSTGLRKHGAETRPRTTRRIGKQQQQTVISSRITEPNKSSRLRSPEKDIRKVKDRVPERSDPEAQIKRAVIQSDSSTEEETETDDDTLTSDSDQSTTEDELYEPSKKQARTIDETDTGSVQMSLANMPMPENTLEKDVLHYIEDMTIYLDHYHQFSESQKAKLVKTGVKGEARDVLMGYAEKELNSTGKIYKILKNEFKKARKEC